MSAQITCTKTVKSITLPCPCCGEEDAGIAINLHDLEGDAFYCTSCENSFTLDFVRRLLRRWTAMMAWVGQVPQFEDDA